MYEIRVYGLDDIGIDRERWKLVCQDDDGPILARLGPWKLTSMKKKSDVKSVLDVSVRTRKNGVYLYPHQVVGMRILLGTEEVVRMLGLGEGGGFDVETWTTSVKELLFERQRPIDGNRLNVCLENWAFFDERYRQTADRPKQTAKPTAMSPEALDLDLTIQQSLGLMEKDSKNEPETVSVVEVEEEMTSKDLLDAVFSSIEVAPPKVSISEPLPSSSTPDSSTSLPPK